MSTYRLQQLFSPRSVALIGASSRPNSLGHAVYGNLKRSGFPGPIGLANPRYARIEDQPCVASLRDLSEPPELAVIVTPPATVPDIISEAGAIGVSAAIILTAGLGHGPESIAGRCERIARQSGIRLLGPNCLGLIAPYAKLNASFSSQMPQAGDLAVISQSGAIAAALCEWGVQNRTGFSAIASIGDQIDVDLGDLLDFFALDPKTRAILMYVESVTNVQKFMSAARAAARIKPIVIIKTGRHAEGARAAATHTGALAGSDAVYDAAFRRAGLLRVFDLAELFDAAETLSHFKTVRGKRLAFLTNGGGIGVLAIDGLRDLGGQAAMLSESSVDRLNSLLPATWSGTNPVDIIGDADADRYVAALDVLLADPQIDAVLVLNVPTAMASSANIAEAISRTVEAQRSKWIEPKPVLASWIGGDLSISRIFEQAGIPHYFTEGEAVRGFMHLVRHQDAVNSLMEMPPSLPGSFKPDAARARAIIRQAALENRRWLDPLEVSALFEAYSIPINPSIHAPDQESALLAAAPFFAKGETVALKIQSRDIAHKSDVGGVRLGIDTGEALGQAAADIVANAKRLRPDARLNGFVVQPMVRRKFARELILGIASDPAFGPVILFGRGGTAVEVINDKALALPPLDLKLANDLIDQTRVARTLARYRDVQPANRDQIALTLVKIAQMAADLPEIDELDINPLLADENGVLALDARVAVSAKDMKQGHSHLAIRPYPSDWERSLSLPCGLSFLVRPVRPDDEPLFQPFFKQVSAEDLRLRFFAPVKEFGHAFLARLTQIDYARSMAFLALDSATGEMLGVVRLHADANHEAAEYAILVRSDLKGRGLGWRLMQLILEYAKADGITHVFGEVLRDNIGMLRMCRELGFVVSPDVTDPDLVKVTYALNHT
jgi:acetyltransferase